MLVLLAAALAQNPAVVPAVPPPPAAGAPQPAGRPKPPAGPPEFEVRFTDGSIVRSVVLDPVATVRTKFGTLVVPFADLKRVDLGFRYPPGVEDQVAGAVGRLGAAAFRDREDAEKELLTLGEYALAAVRRAAESGDPEAVRRAEPLLKKLLAVVPEDRRQLRDHDIVETGDFTFKGRLELAVLNVRTKQFGQVPVRLPEVRGLRALAASPSAVEVALDAARYARQGWPEWLDTGVDVDPEQGVGITAAGAIDQWIQEPGKYMSGPAGTQAQAPGFPGPQPVAAGGPVMRVGAAGRPFQSGMVVGRVGPAGVPFPVGAGFKEARAGVSGRLFLAIAPSNWGNDSVGSYKVQVKVGE